jgi:integrase
MKKEGRKLPKRKLFQKVRNVPCLYRFVPSGLYYARVKTHGKEITQSLRTTDRALANRKLKALKEAREKLDPKGGKVTLIELCDKFLRIIEHQKPKTQEYKRIVVERIKNDWPDGSTKPIVRIKPSECDEWLAHCAKKYRAFGTHARNGHIGILKAVFAVAVRDHALTDSPAEHLKKTKPEKPIRLTPTFEQFQKIIAHVRAPKSNRHHNGSRITVQDGAEDSADFLEAEGLLGLGQAEVRSLTRGDVDFDSDRIITFRHKTKTGFAIPIYPQARSLLEKICASKRHDERLFKIDNRGGAQRALTAACGRLEFPRFSQRSFRRMFIVRAIERGVDPKVIAEWQGHRDGGKMILSIYYQVRSVHSQRMAQLMTTDEPENVVRMPETGKQVS